ncbi:transcriptional regulator [Streptomyces sp. CG1]|uniref:transcriptional regulator n=1 Tax=Streptomyces sp. CG1 TaxID=1287523 RepID=UPI0034E233B5
MTDQAAAGAAPYAVPGLEQLLLDPTRLTIVSLVSATAWCEFAFVRDHTRMSDSALSKQLTTLGGAEPVEIRKGYVGQRRCTWVRATAAGRERLRAHLAALQRTALSKPPAPTPSSMRAATRSSLTPAESTRPKALVPVIVDESGANSASIQFSTCKFSRQAPTGTSHLLGRWAVGLTPPAEHRSGTHSLDHVPDRVDDYIRPVNGDVV